jgi:hypothetical protein
MEFLEKLYGKSRMSRALSGALILAVISIAAGFFIVITNAQRGIGVASFVAIGMTVLYFYFNDRSDIALLLAMIWIGGVIVAPGLIRSIDLLVKPVYRDAAVNEDSIKGPGIYYFKNFVVKKDLDAGYQNDHMYHVGSMKKESVLYSDVYNFVPVVDTAWTTDDPVAVWGTYIQKDKHVPSWMKYSLDWGATDSINAGVVHDIDADVMRSFITLAEKKNKLSSVKKPLIVYLAHDPHEEALLKCAVYSVFGVLMLALWIIFSVKGPFNAPVKADGKK